MAPDSRIPDVQIADPRASFVSRRSAALAAAAVILLAAYAAPSAQRRGGGANLGTPIATNAIAQNPEAYYGKPVTMSAGVETVLSRTVFLVDQHKAIGVTGVKAIGTPIMVIAPYLHVALEQKHYLLMSGQIVKFDPATIARVAADYALDLPPDVAAKYLGQPVLVATSVLSSTSVELNKKALPPPTAEEVSFSAAMKTIGPAFAALRAAAQESKADVVGENAAKLKPAFTQTEVIWDDHGVSSAAESAREARRQAAAIESAAAAGDWDAVRTSAGTLNQVCQGCHVTYRERQDDGTFRIKPGSF